MNINNQPIRIRQQKRRVLRHVMHIQHHPRHLTRKLRRPHPGQKPIIGHIEALARQLRRQPRMPQVEEDAIRILHPRRLILHLFSRRHIQINRHPRITRRRPMPNPRHHRQRPRLRLPDPAQSVCAITASRPHPSSRTTGATRPMLLLATTAGCPTSRF